MSLLLVNKKKTFKLFSYADYLIPKCTFFIIYFIIGSNMNLQAQNKNSTDTALYLNLDQCIAYAMEHQPALKQSGINISIAKKTNTINLSSWYPQVNLSGTLMHYDQLPTTFSLNSLNPEGPPIQGHPGVINTLIPQVAVTQNIFNPDILYSAKTAHLLVQQAMQANDSSKINMISTISSAFYNLLLTLEQMNVLKEDTARLGKNLTDTYHQYIGGIVDKTDYKEAYISLNNSKAQLKQMKENVRPQYAILKQLMGFPVEKEFNVSFDTSKMILEIAIDTTQQLQFEKRIEYQQLQTAKKIQRQVINYNRYSYIPNLSVFYSYYYEYENNSFSNLLPQAYPYSYIGATISLPLFTGFKRSASIQRAKLQLQQLDWAEVDIKSRISSEYISALANYKSNLYNLNTLNENVTMAKDVYGVVSLQYKQGVVAYLNVITAESNLISSEIGYINALFQVLSNKIDLQKSMGAITY